MTTDLQILDQKLIWHPFSQHGLKREILPVESAKGAYLRLSDGREILDGISSWWVNLHGHAHPKIVAAIHKQAETLEHVIFSGFTHRPAVELARLLTTYPAIQDAGLTRAFYSDNGSTAVEVALKMAYQYHLNNGDYSRQRFLALEGAYHGDTLGAMSVSDPGGFHSKFRKLMPEVDFIKPGDRDALERLLNLRAGGYAGFIFEPLLQGSEGMKIYDSEFLKDAVELCRSRGILTICDEIFTGFYRTGKCFAFEHVGIRPDLICLSKGLTGGFLPLSVTLCQERIFEGFLSDQVNKAFLHGHSYTANPVACAAGIASWEILHSPETQARIEALCAITQNRVNRLKNHSRLQDARCLGTVGALELKEGPSYYSHEPQKYMAAALKQNVLVRPLGGVLYTVPPYCCTDEELHRIYDILEEIMML